MKSFARNIIAFLNTLSLRKRTKIKDFSHANSPLKMKTGIRNSPILFVFILLITVFISSDASALVCDGGVDCIGANQTSCEAVSGCTWVTNPNVKDQTAFVVTICNLVSAATGTAGKIIASFAVIAIGVGFFTGKVSWGLMLGVGSGIATMFGAVSIVSAISGTNVFNCVVTFSTACTSSSPGFSFPANSTPTDNTANNNGSVRIRCDDGYYGIVNNLVCFDQEWFGASGQCLQSSCENPNAASLSPNVAWRSTSANDGDTITGDCKTGFTSSSTSSSTAATARCELSSYVDIVDTCIALPECTPSTPGFQTFGTYSAGPYNGQPYGSWSKTTVFVGDSPYVTCTNSSGTPPSQIRCVYNTDRTAGIWEGGHDGDCKVFEACTAASIPASADLGTFGSWPNSGEANHGDIINGTCTEGYEADGAPELTCEDGTYVGFNDLTCPSGCETSTPGFTSLSADGTWDGTWVSGKLSFGESLTGVCPGGSYPTPSLECSKDTDNNPLWVHNGSDCFAPCTNASAEYRDLSTGGSWTLAGSPWDGTTLVKFEEKIIGDCPGGHNGGASAPELECNQGINGSEWFDNGFDCYHGCDTSSTDFRALLEGGTWQDGGIAGHTQIITGTCPGGYDIQPSLTCNNGAWEADSAGVCYQECSGADAILALPGTSSWPKQIGAFSETISASCEFTSPNPPQLKCGSNGTWAVEGTGACLQGCTNAGAVNLTSVLGFTSLSQVAGNWPNGGNANPNQTLTAQCDHGANTPPQITCNGADGTWTVVANSGICLNKCTGTPPALANGGSWGIPGVGADHNAEFTASCPSGGPNPLPKIKCNGEVAGGAFTPLIAGNCYPACTNANSVTPLPGTSSWPTAPGSYNNVITASCEFTSPTPPQLRCGGDGIWAVERVGACLQGCTNANAVNLTSTLGFTSLSQVEGSWPNGGTANPEQTLTATCVNGANTFPQIKCNGADGTWTVIANSGICLNKCTGATPALSSGGTWGIPGTGAAHNAEFTASCPTGGSSPLPKIKCNGEVAGGAFTQVTAGDCYVGCTGAPTQPIPNGSWPTAPVSHGATVNATCPDGPSSGKPQLTCNNGTYSFTSGSATSCYQQCNPNAPDVNIGATALAFSGTWNKATKQHGQTITANCPSGSFSGAAPTLTCNGATGLFTKSGSDCTVTCNVSNAPSISGVSWSPSSGTVNEGNSITSACASGYRKIGTLGPLTCQSDGSWSGDTSGECERITCKAHSVRNNSNNAVANVPDTYVGCVGNYAHNVMNICCPDGRWSTLPGYMTLVNQGDAIFRTMGGSRVGSNVGCGYGGINNYLPC